MEKEFLDVFRNLELNGELKALLKEVVVTKVSVNQKKDHIRVYIRSRQWIHKKYIYALEEAIASQCFRGVPMTVKVLEKFQLSSQYTPELFFDAYKSSMGLELRNYSILVFNMFRNAVITFPKTNEMHMVLQSTVLAKSKEEELIGYMEKVFCERSGFSLQVETEYQEVKESKYRKNSDIRIQQEAAHIIEMSALGRGKDEQSLEETEELEKEQKSQTSGEKKSETRAKEKGNAKEKSFQGEKGRGKGDRNFSSDYRRSVKRSDNPDVLYGRDFEDDAIPLETIQSEMGEVSIRGQIMTLEKREIRNEKTIIIFSVTDFTDSITVKMFARNDQVEEITAGVKEKAFIKLKGITTIDRYDSEAPPSSEAHYQIWSSGSWEFS